MYQTTLEIQRLPEGPYLGTTPELAGLIVQAKTVEEVITLRGKIILGGMQIGAYFQSLEGQKRIPELLCDQVGPSFIREVPELAKMRSAVSIRE